MKHLKHNQQGIAHLGLLLASLVVIGVVGFAGIRVYSSHATEGDPDVLGTNTTTNGKQKVTKKKTTASSNGAVQIVVKEQVKDSKGKTKTVARGNVPVELQASSDKLRCRDAGKIFIKKGNVAFSGKTDADKDHKINLGKIKADSCKIGDYTAAVKVSDKYSVVGASTKKVSVKKKKVTVVSFTIKKKGTQSTSSTQDTSTVPTPAPEPQPTAPITPALEKAAIDRTLMFERDILPEFKWCTPQEDLGRSIENRKKYFAQNATKYATPALISKVNSLYGGDAFQLLGVSQLLCGQYNTISTDETKPLVSSSTGTTAVVEHTFKAIPRDPPTGGLPKASEFQKIWVYNLVRDGDTWKIDSISLK